jgi:hypothetical protein
MLTLIDYDKNMKNVKVILVFFAFLCYFKERKKENLKTGVSIKREKIFVKKCVLPDLREAFRSGECLSEQDPVLASGFFRGSFFHDPLRPCGGPGTPAAGLCRSAGCRRRA